MCGQERQERTSSYDVKKAEPLPETPCVPGGLFTISCAVTSPDSGVNLGFQISREEMAFLVTNSPSLFLGADSGAAKAEQLIAFLAEEVRRLKRLREPKV